MLNKSLQYLKKRIDNGLYLFAIWEDNRLFLIDNKGKIRYNLVVDCKEAEGICKSLSLVLLAEKV